MEGVKTDSSSCRYIAARLTDAKFTLVDIGCAGGIDRIWRAFEGRLQVFAFDSNVDECARLRGAETLPGVSYIAGFVGVPADHPVAKHRGGKPHHQRNPWGRLAVVRSLAIQDALRPAHDHQSLTSRLADPAIPIYLPDFFRARSVGDVDFIKIDVDGPDFDILQTLAQSLKQLNVLAVGMEVNFFGSSGDTDHTFHNTDRFMRGLDFALAHLTVRPYSLAALPARYQIKLPGQSWSGPPFQGDALYVRDLGNPEQRENTLHPTGKLAKLVAIYSAFGLYDCAAEVVLTHREKLSEMLEPEHLLDLLCAEAQGGRERNLSYRDYMAAFEKDDDWFYPMRGA